MDPQTRTAAFAILLIGLSSLVLLQTIHASNGLTAPSVVAPQNFGSPLQNSNSTAASNQTMPTSSTSAANATSLATLSPVMNSTALATISTVGVSGGYNASTAVSYVQFQMTSMSQQLSAMSSSLDSVGQQANNNTVIAESGLIVGIIAIVVAFAVARRADAMNRGPPQSPAVALGTGKP